MADEGHDDADHIRQQMMETRTALTEKLETLENQVIGSVQEATSAVTETVTTVKEAVQDTVGTLKESVQETVETVKETFDLQHQVRHHPWAMFGGSILLGFLGGRLLSGASSSRPSYRARPTVMDGRSARLAPPEGSDASQREAIREAFEPEKGWVAQLAEQFAPELQRLKGAAIGATVALVRDMVAPSLPEPMNPKFREVMDDVAGKLGGDVIREPLLQQQANQPVCYPEQEYERRVTS